MTDTPAKPNFSQIAKKLLRKSRQGALATLMEGSGDPYCSLVNVASCPDGAPILLISKLALHTCNILSDPRVSLLLDERGSENALEGARIMLAGMAMKPDAETARVMRRRYLAAHPAASGFIGFPDFSLFRIEPHALHLVAGFGRITDLEPETFMTDLADADDLVEAEPDALAHMNADHRDTMDLYATRLLGGSAGDWHCTGCDPEGLDLQNGSIALRLDFPRRCATLAALRQILIEMADQARGAG
jgi:putative heme iron utilization protein